MFVVCRDLTYLFFCKIHENAKWIDGNGLRKTLRQTWYHFRASQNWQHFLYLFNPKNPKIFFSLRKTTIDYDLADVLLLKIPIII
jgi:hypothetical protein